MKPETNKKFNMSGGEFTTDEGLKITIPPKNIAVIHVLRKELLEKQDFMEIDANSCYVYKDEKGNVVRRVSESGKILTESKSQNKEDAER